MPLLSIPVVAPYRLDGDAEGTVRPVQVHTVASSPAAALATAQVLAATLATIRHPGHQARVLLDRARVGTGGGAITGLYGYVLIRGSRIHRLVFPARLDHHAGDVVAETFAGIDAGTVHGVVLDCAYLSYIDTTHLAAIAGHAQRLNLHLFRVSEPVARVFGIAGLDQVVNLVPTFQAALAGLVARHRMSGRAPTTD